MNLYFNNPISDRVINGDVYTFEFILNRLVVSPTNTEGVVRRPFVSPGPRAVRVTIQGIKSPPSKQTCVCVYVQTSAFPSCDTIGF